MSIHWTLILTILFTSSIYAQNNPPEFTCLVGNGTEYEVSWTPPASPCGTVTGYRFYYSPVPQGPYQFFTIFNPAATDTIFPSAQQVLYCYMETVASCPGQPTIPSDTLNFTLAPPNMKTVSVNPVTGLVEVTWLPGSSADIAAYLVYVDGANFPDTVWGNASTVYTDFVSDAAAAPHTYRLAWFRDCANDGDRRGTIGQPYKSIQAYNLQQDECERSFLFNWTAYENYTDGVNGYEIEVSINNGPYAPVDTVPISQQLFSFKDAIKDNFYCFRINALLPGDCKASSNVLCDTARVVDFPLGAHLRNVTVLDGNTVQLEYYPDTSGVVDLFRAQRTESGTNFQEWPVTLNSMAGNPVYEIYTDDNAQTASRDYWYRFYREDECANGYATDSAKTILLFAKIGPGLTGRLQWTPFVLTNAEVLSYTVTRVVNGSATEIATVDASTFEYEDASALNPTQLDTVCYFITAEAEQVIPGRASNTLTSNSNIDCLEPTPRIITPTAFAPEGFNQIFLPIISFGTGVDYQFRIWDRWGTLLFESNDPNIGWDGTYNGKIVMMDNYAFLVSFVGQDGMPYSKVGNVIVFR